MSVEMDAEERVRAAFTTYLAEVGSSQGAALASRLHDIACEWADAEDIAA